MAAGVATEAAQSSPIPANVCSQMVESATRSCQPLISVPPEPTTSTADSLAALSTAFTFGSLLLAVIALLGALAWGFVVKGWAETEAKKVAKACADEYIKEWMAKEAPGIIRSQVDLLNDATIGEGDDADAADEIGKEAG